MKKPVIFHFENLEGILVPPTTKHSSKIKKLISKTRDLEEYFGEEFQKTKTDFEASMSKIKMNEKLTKKEFERLWKTFSMFKGFYPIDLHEYTKDGENINTGDYAIKFHSGSYDTYYIEYTDASYGVCLFYGKRIKAGHYTKTKNIANILFSSENGGIHINQIQGGKGSYKFLKQIKWTRFLVDFIIDCATCAEIDKIYILAAKKIAGRR